MSEDRDSTKERETIQRNCARFRKEADLSLQALAARTGLNSATLWRYEKGRSTPDRDALRALAEAYGRSVDDFYADEPPPPRLRPPVQRAFMILGELDPDLRRQLEEEAGRVIERINREQLARTRQIVEQGRRKKKL